MSPKTSQKLRLAQHATRTHRRDGTAVRLVALWDSKVPAVAKCIGFVDPKTMDAVTERGAWEHDGPSFADYADTATEHWWKVTD